MEGVESKAIAALSGLGLNSFLSEAGLPATDIYTDQLGLSSSGLFGARAADDGDEGAIGADVGEDMEEDVEPEPYPEPDVQRATTSLHTGPDAEKKKKVRVVKRMVEKPKSVYERYPSFRPGKTLAFSELFKGYINRKSRISKRPFHVYSVYPYRRDVAKGYLQTMVNEAYKDLAHVDDKASGLPSLDEDMQLALDKLSHINPALVDTQDRSFDLVHLANWEDQIIYSPAAARDAPHFQEFQKSANPTNQTLESGEWTKSIIWEPGSSFRDFTQLELNEVEEVQNEYGSQNTNDASRRRPRNEQGPPRDVFNLSNDHHYEIPKHVGARQRVRQTFGQLEVQHAYPALKLQLPFYKTRLSKQDARSFHRPPLQFHANVECHFAKVRTAKKKKDKSGRTLGKGGAVSEAIKHTGDLSLRENTNFILWEYSEEHPPIMPNFGMGSILVNYYRKKNDLDDHVPKSDYGEPFVLEPNDDSPFMRFGYVYPGQTIPALYNNLVRAPLFKHKPYPTDFLIIRTSVKNEVRYYIREVKSIYVVGQTFPVTEVPGPHSRKITTTVKHRLQIIAFKLLRKSPEERLKINRLMKYFPDQNELQMRQRLKEFMEYHRRGPHQGFWRLKPTVTIPSDQDMLKMLSPESVVLAESMQVGQRHLQDSGYGRPIESEEADESNLSIEQQLAPWITSKNFLQAAQNKAMLKLHGDGDPTGRGEAFSFIRVSMKEIFVRAGEDYEQKMAEADNRPKHAHRYNVQEQQVIYRSEVERIWKAQYESLCRKDEPELSENEDERRNAQAPRKERPELASLANERQATGSPGMSRASSLDRDINLGLEGPSSRVLRIRRMVDGEWETEIVRDPAVIAAYIHRRQIIEEESTKADALAPTGDAERDKRAKKRLEEEIARMKKNQERRLIRKNAKIIKDGGVPLQLRRPMKPDTTRRCGLCGQVGHMKTNRKCPKWAEANMGPTAGPSTTGSTGGTPTQPSLLEDLSQPGSSLPVTPVLPAASSVRDTPPPPPPPAPAPQAIPPKIKLTIKRT